MASSFASCSYKVKKSFIENAFLFSIFGYSEELIDTSGEKACSPCRLPAADVARQRSLTDSDKTMQVMSDINTGRK